MLVAMRARYGLLALTCLVALALVIGPSLTSASVSASPTTFVAVTEEGQQFRSDMSIYSASTGVLIRRLASFSDTALTGNGLAYAADGSAAYFTLIPQHHTRQFSLRLMRLDVATRHQSFIADGAQPALSDDGTRLAYAASPNGVAVRDLTTGQTRRIALRQLGSAADLLTAAIGWLGDGSDLAVVPAPTAWDLVGRPPKLHWCGTSQSRPVIVFVHVPAPPAPMTASCVHLPQGALGAKVVLGEDPASPATALLATDTPYDKTLIERIAKDGDTSPLLTIPNSLPLSFDPSGTRLLYLVGHRPPTLIEANIADTHLTNGPWRNTRLSLGAVAW